MLKLPNTLFLVFATVLLNGCAIPLKQQNDTRVVAVDGSSGAHKRLSGTIDDSDKPDIYWLFRYYRQISTMTTSQLADNYVKTKSAFSEKKSLKNQWQLAILLSIPNTSFYDLRRSSDLIEELTNNDLEHDFLLNDAAYLINDFVKEQNLTNKILDTIETQSIESQAANKSMQIKLKSLETQLIELQAANQTLQDQIKALKAIEDALNQRNKAEEKPKP